MFHNTIVIVKNVSISLIARNDEGLIVGVFGLTDFCYWLYVTDLGVDRNYERLKVTELYIEIAKKYDTRKEKPKS